MHGKPWIFFGVAATAVLLLLPSTASANILGSHAFSWWDDPQGTGTVVVLPLGAAGPAGGTRLLDLREWHLDQPQTTAWYAGGAVAGLPLNPFNAANRTGVTPGSVIPAVAGAEAFIYELTNVNYQSGNGPVGGPPFTFTDPAPPGPGVNDLSGINIIDTGGALNISLPAPGTQFMFTHLGVGVPSNILDMTPGSVLTPQDWDFNANSGPGNFEWDIIPANGAGVASGFLPAVLGFAMPGNWLDAINDGWVHSWQPVGPVQVNIANAIGGFSGPVPEPTTLGLLAIGGLLVARRRPRKLP